MGYQTPNIDRIGKEGALFTAWYGQQSCTAGRAAFITGQSPIRTGLTKVGLPGADVGLQPQDPTIAEVLKPLGYATGQFGKNHLGDKDEFLPTNHGFDEFFGNLYHLNAEEEPENVDYPKNPQFKKKFGPRGVIHSYAGGKIEDTGPLTRKRMETVDEEFLAAALDFMDRQKKEGEAVLRVVQQHADAHLHASQGRVAGEDRAGSLPRRDGRARRMVGQLLKKLDDLGIANDTIVVYGTDNGAEVMSWPDGGATPYKGEKATGWEGGFRTPCLIRWPGVIKPGIFVSDFFAHEDFLPTFAAAAGDTDVVARCMKGCQSGKKTFKVHLDGYNLIPYFKGEVKESPRKEFLYWSDDGDLLAIRVNHWKVPSRSRNTPVSTSGSGNSRASAARTSTTCARTPSSAARVVRIRPVGRGSFVPARPGPGDRRAVARELQGVPDPAEAGQLQPGFRHGEAVAEELGANADAKTCPGSRSGLDQPGQRQFRISGMSSPRCRM
jgi:arylsulfatase